LQTQICCLKPSAQRIEQGRTAPRRVNRTERPHSSSSPARLAIARRGRARQF
jgi:hypothetical protein